MSSADDYLADLARNREAAERANAQKDERRPGRGHATRLRIVGFVSAVGSLGAGWAAGPEVMRQFMQAFDTAEWGSPVPQVVDEVGLAMVRLARP